VVQSDPDIEVLAQEIICSKWPRRRGVGFDVRIDINKTRSNNLIAGIDGQFCS